MFMKSNIAKNVWRNNVDIW